MTQDLNISATFGMITKDLIVSVNGQGEANGTGTYLLGTNVSIEAIPADGHNFTGWSGIGAANPGLAATTVFMSSDRTLTANFAINEYNLVINSSTVELKMELAFTNMASKPTFPPIQILE